MPAQTRHPRTYQGAGVDRQRKDAILGTLTERIRSTHRGAPLAGAEPFGGLFPLAGWQDPVLVSSIDGVGTKTEVARLLDRWPVVGADIVAHGANDVLCHGAAPVFMLDYIASGRLRADVITGIVEGIAEACRALGIALIGGETAEMPGIYAHGTADVVGCTVGVVERTALITGEAICPGDAIVGLGSDGLHTNGYSLARAVLLAGNAAAGRRALGRRPRGWTETLGEALLRPHRAYTRSVLPLRGRQIIRGIAHVTGGGIAGNLVRILPAGVRARIRPAAWPVPPVFTLIRRRGGIAADEMFRTFNMGIGLLLVVPAGAARAAVGELERMGERAWVVGDVEAGAREVVLGD